MREALVWQETEKLGLSTAHGPWERWVGLGGPWTAWPLQAGLQSGATGGKRVGWADRCALAAGAPERGWRDEPREEPWGSQLW